MKYPLNGLDFQPEVSLELGGWDTPAAVGGKGSVVEAWNCRAVTGGWFITVQHGIRNKYNYLHWFHKCTTLLFPLEQWVQTRLFLSCSYRGRIPLKPLGAEGSRYGEVQNQAKQMGRSRKSFVEGSPLNAAVHRNLHQGCSETKLGIVTV